MCSHLTPCAISSGPIKTLPKVLQSPEKDTGKNLTRAESYDICDLFSKWLCALCHLQVIPHTALWNTLYCGRYFTKLELRSTIKLYGRGNIVIGGLVLRNKSYV